MFLSNKILPPQSVEKSARMYAKYCETTFGSVIDKSILKMKLLKQQKQAYCIYDCQYGTIIIQRW